MLGGMQLWRTDFDDQGYDTDAHGFWELSDRTPGERSDLLLVIHHAGRAFRCLV
jgi:hypothetical protein